MTRSLLSLSLLATTALAPPVAAEITPAEVWQDLKAYMEAVGYSVSGTETGGGDQLVVEDVRMVSAEPDGAGEVRIEIGTVRFTDTGAAVAVVFPERMPIRFDFETEPGERTSGTIDYTQTGLDMEVTGSANAPLYVYAAEGLALSLAELTVDGTEVGPETSRFEVTFSDVTGRSASDIGATRMVAQRFGAAEIGYDMFFADPEDRGAQVRIEGRMAAVDMEASSDLPLVRDTSQTSDPFALGLIGDAVFRHGGGALSLAADDNGTVSTYSATSESGELGIDMTQTGLGYSVTSTGVALQLATPDIPVPVALEAAETAFTLAGPLRPTEEAQPYALAFALRGFEMADTLWSLFDPGGALPRDPAALDVDLSGEMRALVDLFDEEAVMALGEEDLPLALDTISINRLILDLAGARLTGDGGFTFDNDNLTAFDGFPAPEGAVTFELTGANALMDTLIRMGVLPQEQAMGMRMMMSMFAQPAGDDRLVSTIEVRSTGQVLANGQRLR